MKIKFAAVSILVALFIGCEDDKVVAITDKPVYAELTARYTKATNSTVGTSQFWDGSKGGRKLIFHPSAKLLFNDVTMDYNNVDYLYSKSLEGFHSPSNFKITDVNDKTFDNSITITSAELPTTSLLDTINSSVPLIITWVGSAVQDDETITLRIAGVGAKQNVKGSTSVTFSLSDFASLTSSKNSAVELSIERTKSVGLTVDLGGSGNIKAEYIGLPKTVFLK